jgi:hypothetical protein
MVNKSIDLTHYSYIPAISMIEAVLRIIMFLSVIYIWEKAGNFREIICDSYLQVRKNI